MFVIEIRELGSWVAKCHEVSKKGNLYGDMECPGKIHLSK